MSRTHLGGSGCTRRQLTWCQGGDMSSAVKHRRRWPWLAFGLPLLVLAVLVGVWGLALRARGDHVARNVRLAGHEVGDADRASVVQLVDRLADDARTTPIHVTTSEHHAYDTTASALGLSLDRDATVGAVLAVDRSGVAPLRPFRWAASFLTQRTISPRYTIDRDALGKALPALEGDNRTAPVDPTIAQTERGAITVAAGVAGHGVDADQLATALLQAAPRTAPGAPLEVQVGERAIAPAFTDTQAQAVADDAVRLARQQLTLTVGGKSKVLDVPTVAAWFRAVPHDHSLVLAVEPDALKFTVAALFGDSIGEAPADASFTLDGHPILHPGHDGTTCCEPGAGDAILR